MNLKIYLITFVLNFLYSCFFILGLDVSIKIAGKGPISNSVYNLLAWLLLLVLLLLFVLLNFFCFKYCASHKQGGVTVHLVNLLFPFLALAISFLLYLQMFQ